MKTFFSLACCWFILGSVPLTSAQTAAVHATQVPAAAVPATKSVQMLVAGETTPQSPYLAFPASLDTGREVLVSFKSGRSHAADGDATQQWIRLDKATGKVLSQGTLASLPGEIMQMGEWVRYSNGDIANYIDAQAAVGSLRTGLAVVRSTDGGKTFGPLGRMGVVDGVEYGYAFDAITRGESTWMLVMTFANLKGGKQVYQTKSQPGSVDVIRTDDNGRSWRFVRSITQELGGAPINESAFMAQGEGFIVTARGYDNRQWLLRTDGEFKLITKTELNAAYEFITSHIGRPRLFERNGSSYLLGRNWIAKGVMQLALFKFDPNTLAIKSHVVLDNAESQKVADGYYAQPYWRQDGDRTRFHIVTYKRAGAKSADIIRLEFDWSEVR